MRLESVWQDLVYVWRSCRRQPAFALTAVATLTLGIGATTAIFSVLNAVLLTPPPYPDPDRIVMIGTESGVSAAKFNLWREATSATSASPQSSRQRTPSLRDLAAWRVSFVNVGGEAGRAEPEEVASVQASANFFPLFGAGLTSGRGFDAADDRPDAGHVAILGYGFWRRHFGADPHIIGHSLSLNGVPHVIVGVLSERFDGGTIVGPFWESPQIWTPLQLDPQSLDQTNALYAAARLASDVTITQATTQARDTLRRAAIDFKRRFPGVMLPDDEFGLEPLQRHLTGDVRTPLLVLAGAVCFVLLIACANVANLLLARASARGREIAIRTAIGAGRRRIIRQLLTESLALALVSGVAGLLAGTLGVRALLALNPGTIPRITTTAAAGASTAAITADWRVLAFTVLVTCATALLFGLLPALHASRTDLIALTSPASRGSATGGRLSSRLRAQSVLVIAEMTLAVALLIGAALLIRTFVALYSVETGFDRQHVLTMRMSLREARFARTSAVAEIAEAGVTRVNALPGVIASTASYCLPIQGYLTLRFTIPNVPLSGPYHGMGSWGIVSPGYFDVFKIRLLRGRLFTNRDTRGTPPVAIISETLARRFFPKADDDPLQHQIVLGRGLGAPFDQENVRQIVGVVGDVRERDLTRDLQPTTYVPLAQQPDGLTALTSNLGVMTWSARIEPEPQAGRTTARTATAGTAATRTATARIATAREIADALKNASGGLPVSHVRSMNDVMSTATASATFNTVLLTIFACAAALLAAIGIYGLMSYAIHQRTHEFGVRLALGADPRAVRHLILRDGLRLAANGVTCGLGMSFALSRVLSGSLFAVSPHDPLVFTSVPLLLILIALAATWPPGRQITRIDPVIALRRE